MQLPRAEIDNNNFNFFPKDNPARVTAEYFEETFNEPVVIFIGLERRYDTVFDKTFLQKIRDFENAVQTVEFVKDVNSIISTQYIRGEGDSIIVADLVNEDFSGTPEEIAELKRRVASWDMYRGAIVSGNLLATQMTVSLDIKTEESGLPEVTAVLVTIRDMAKEMFAGLAEVYVAGQPVISASLSEAMQTDVIILIPLVIIVVLGVLFFSFRRLAFVLLPLLAVIISVVWTIGAMPLFGIKLTILSSIMPVILTAVGSAYGIHVVTHYAHDAAGRTLTVEEHRNLVFDLMKKLIKPVFLAALTTFAGFISFCFTTIIPMRSFGYFSSFGVIVAFAVAVTLIPALLLVRGPRVLKKRKEAGYSLDNAIGSVFLPIVNRKPLVLVATALVIVLSFYGLSKVVVDNAAVEFFRDDSDISRSDRFIREYFGGSKPVSVSISADSAEILLSPESLGAVDDLSVYLANRVPNVAKVMGFTDIIKRINQVFNVDESPAGLAPVQNGYREMELDRFGFEENSFGFVGNFSVPEPEDPAVQAETVNHSPSQYNAGDIITLLNTVRAVSPTLSADDMVQELNRLINFEGFSYYEVPRDPFRYGKETSDELQRLVSNYLVLLAGGDDNSYSNDPLEPTALKMMVQVNSQWNRDTEAVIDMINAYVDENFPDTLRVITGGSGTLEGAMSDLIMNSQIISIVISVLVVFIIVALSNRSLVAGVIAAVPLTIAILGNFAAMGFLGITLNVGTALVASLAVGIGIDYTIHFIEFFKHEYEAGGEYLRRTFTGSGKAIVINALSVGAGFGVLAFSQFRVIAYLGALIALSMFITALVSLTVIPVLLISIKPRFIYGGKK
jgi:predicted RND superfamily exporter protein